MLKSRKLWNIICIIALITAIVAGAVVKVNLDRIKEATQLPILAESMMHGTSYEVTMRENKSDKKVIEKSDIDFSDITIACIGDSITEGKNGSVPYPTYLKEILGAKEVYNYGVGGVPLARRRTGVSFFDTLDDIDDGIDVIVVLGGGNDMFYNEMSGFGDIKAEERVEYTFCSELEVFMETIKKDFPEALTIYLAPSDNVLYDLVREDTELLVDKELYAEAFQVISVEQDVILYDMYNSYFLSAQDDDIKEEFMQDNIHFNSKGHEIIATKVAALIIKNME